MSDAGLLIAQTGYNLRGFLRNSRALIFTVIMPVFLLLLFCSIFTGHTHFHGHDVPTPTYYTAAIVAYQIMLAGFGSLLITVTTTREAGRLKRFRGTPMPPWVYLASEIGQTVAVVLTTVVVIVAVGAVFYNVDLPVHALVGLVFYVVVGTAGFCALALATTRVSTSAETASAVGPFVTVILAFFSGVFIPVAAMPHWLLDLGKVFPLEHVADGLQTAFLSSGSTGITLSHVAVIGVWGVAGLVVALRTFQWEALAAGQG